MTDLSAAQTLREGDFKFQLLSKRNAFVVLDARGHEVGAAHFTDTDHTRSFDHTVVHQSLRGTGLSTLLAAYALTHKSTVGKRILAPCWFIAQVIQRHPETVHHTVATGIWGTKTNNCP